LFDDAKPIDGIYTESELQRAYMAEKQAYDDKSRSYTQTIIGTALAKDSTSKKMWKDAVKKRKSLRKEWERRKRDFDATRESLR
jgi:predicted secreted Zn-dependent protease